MVRNCHSSKDCVLKDFPCTVSSLWSLELCSLLCFGMWLLYEKLNTDFNLSNKNISTLWLKLQGALEVHNPVFASCSLGVCCRTVCTIVRSCGCSGGPRSEGCQRN